MLSKTDISKETKLALRKRAQAAVASLQKRHINAQYVANRQDALSVILEMIPKEAKIVRGDSITLNQIGIISELKKTRQYNLVDPFIWDDDGYLVAPPEERTKMQREAFWADVFLAGINAITLDGKIVNTDARGNRISPMIFGPKKVILVAGANKVVRDLDEAFERIKICATLNARRHVFNHHHEGFSKLPCFQTGSCVDCRHEWRICGTTAIIESEYAGEKGRLNVILVGEELGL